MLVAEAVAGLEVPVVAVLGNHDHHAGCAERITDELTARGITVLEGSSVAIEAGGTTLGIAGAKGFGGGFAGACASDFGEPEMKAFVRHTKDRSEEHTSELQSLMRISYAVFCLKK